MVRGFKAHRALVLAAITALGWLSFLVAAGPASAHGSTQRPASRVYTCRFEQPDNQMCAGAWAANSQALYDWMEVNIGDAGGRHQELIPNGQLCSAGRQKYAAFDRPGAWPVTALTTDSSGNVDLVYENTAPHSTAYYRVYITGAGFDARTDSVGWGDLELVYDSGPLDRAAVQTMRTPLPNRSTPAVLYIVWQRSDSPEAFYACSDVTVNAGGGNPGPAPTTSPPPTTSPTTSPPTTAPVDPPAPATSTTTKAVTTTTPPPQTSRVVTTEAAVAQTTTTGGATTQATTTKTTTVETTTVETTAEQTTSEQAAATSGATSATGASSEPSPGAPSIAPLQGSSTALPDPTLVTPESGEQGPGSPDNAGVSPIGQSDDAADLESTSDVVVEDPGALDQALVPGTSEDSSDGGSPLGLAMIGLGSLGLVMMGAGLRWPHRIFP